MSGAATIEVARAGLLTTVQDLGRWGHQAAGVPVAGPMDTYAHRLANALLDNDAGAATLEVTLIGPELDVDRPVCAAVAGAAFELSVNGTSVPMHQPFDIPRGGRLRFGARLAGARAYVAFGGGVLTPPVMGSRATHLVSGMGGLDGRALRAGDTLPVGSAATSAGPRPSAPARCAHVPADGRPRLRVLLGPQDAWFTAQAIDALTHEVFQVTTRSNRMAFALEGPALPVARAGEPLSEPVPFGAIQVPAGGAPLMLMADRQTAGGYLKIATVILADLPVAGQLAPGDGVRFTPCTKADALAALIARERDLLRITPGAGLL